MKNSNDTIGNRFRDLNQLRHRVPLLLRISNNYNDMIAFLNIYHNAKKKNKDSL
jgi:hypothetical protein